MFFTSFLPLWISIIVLDCWAIIDTLAGELQLDSQSQKSLIQSVLRMKIELFSVVGLLLYIIISVYCISKEITRQKNAENKGNGTICQAKRANKLTTEFLLAYILPMVAFDFRTLKGVILFLIYFSALGFLCIRNSNVYANIFLEIKGYKMYECNIQCIIMNQKFEFDECLVISRRNLVQSLPQEISFFDFENYIYIDIGE